MNMQEEIFCYHCEKEFYLNGFRMRNAKTVSCFFCGKRIDKAKCLQTRQEESNAK